MRTRRRPVQQLRALEASAAAVAIDDKTSGIVADHQSRRHHDVTTATAAGLRLAQEDQFAGHCFWRVAFVQGDFPTPFATQF